MTIAAAACGSPPDAGFDSSSDGGPVPHEVGFVPVETSESATFSWEFGDGNTSDERSPRHTYQDAGEFTVRLTVSNGGSQVFSERSVRLEPGEAGWIIVDPPALALESGERRSFSVSAFDTLGNPVPDAEYSWSANVSAGSVLEDGTFIAGPNTGNYLSALKVEYERLGATASTVIPVEIVYGSLDSISVEPPAINLRVNSRVVLKVVARDRQGHVLPEPDIEWLPVRGGVDTVLSGGEFRAGLLPTPGEQQLVTVRVSVAGETREQTLSGVITPGILDRVDVTPATTGAAVGDSISLNAEAFDRFGNILVLDSLEWQLVSDEYGEITQDGVFTPSGGAVTATGPLVSAVGELDRVRSFVDVSLDILPGIAAGISLTPVADSVTVGSGNPYLALVVDEFGNVIDGIDVEWSTSSAGRITDEGVFIAGFETGQFSAAVTATIAAGVAGNLEELSASTDIVIRDRSSDLIAVEVSSATDAGILLIDLTEAVLLSLSDELDTDGGIELSPAWWPDGSRLAYSSDVSGTTQVYDIEIATGRIRQLVDDPDGSAMPAISPDGTRIAYIATTGDDWQLFVADLPAPDSEGNISPVTRVQATRLSVDDTVQSLLPWWSPDGSTIAFTSSRSLADIDISVVASDGSSPPRRIGDKGLSAFGWSEDGEFILAVDNLSAGGQSLVVIDGVTGDIAGFIPLPFQAFLAAWAPDSSEVAVIDRLAGAMWLLDSDGSSVRQALGNTFVPRRTAWRPVPIDAAAVLAERAGQPQQP